MAIRYKALTELYQETQRKVTAPAEWQQFLMFSKRTIRPHVAVTSVDTASEALAVSISEKACVDMDYMAELSGKSPEELESELAGVIFRNIEGPESPDELRGNSLSLQAFTLSTCEYSRTNGRMVVVAKLLEE